IAREDRVAVAGDAAAAHDEPDQLLRRTVPGDLLERRPAYEIGRLVELHDSPQPSLERIGLGVELIAVERHPRFEPEGVARSQAARDHAAFPAGVQEARPHVRGTAPLDEDLEAVLARVARPRDERGDTRDRALRDRVVAEPGQVDPGQRPEDGGRLRTLD